MKKSVVLSNACKLSIKNGQLVITLKTGETEESFTRHLEDFGMVILENQQITLTHAVLQELARNNVVLVSCDRNHMPVFMSWSMDVHHTHGMRSRFQIEAGLPLKKQLWKQTVIAKIANQASVLKELGKEAAPLIRWSKEVQSGDSTHREGIAAKYYFQQLFGKDWVRDPEGKFPNAHLNYGYTLLRASMARAIVGAGLLPVMGIQHSNKYNSYPLADDLMEPFRPFVDIQIFLNLEEFAKVESLNSAAKQKLFDVLNFDSRMSYGISPLQIAMESVAAQVAKCFCGEKKKVEYPVPHYDRDIKN